ncbi:hypothetical protein AMTR_s00097p00038490 [Amborella trichopoda]|uniref:Uncharacterized protein n=1 Tax=Amborella trichopoda TaxID=13333 RepID=W1P453_AMBTC|nr:hypothetical protein AMTR_s00097p00038490 [Amborella trichopoda]
MNHKLVEIVLLSTALINQREKLRPHLNALVVHYFGLAFVTLVLTYKVNGKRRKRTLFLLQPCQESPVLHLKHPTLKQDANFNHEQRSEGGNRIGSRSKSRGPNRIGSDMWNLNGSGKGPGRPKPVATPRTPFGSEKSTE